MAYPALKDPRMRKRLDIGLLMLTYLIVVIGILIVYSSSYGQSGGFHKKQLLFAVIGTAALVAAMRIDFHFYGRLAQLLYILNLIVLAIVGLTHLAKSENGATRWIAIGSFHYQPSETAKIVVIIALGTFLVNNRNSIKKWRTLLLSLALVLVPAALVIKQPDLGTGLVLFAIWFSMVFVAGARMKHLVTLFAVGTVLFTGLWITGIWPRPFQRQRLMIFLGLREDPKHTGYHVAQARIAVGSGGLFGKGFLKSTQVQGGWVPERQTDFIFADIGEEFGFVGCITIVTLYGLLIYRGVRIVIQADEDPSGKLIATGVVGMIAFHIVQNIGMNIGVMPVAGVPLVLISYGGSSMIVTLFSIGLLESVALHRHQLDF